MIRVTTFDGPPPAEEEVHGILFRIGEKEMAMCPQGTGHFYVHQVTFEWGGKTMTIPIDAAAACNSEWRHDGFKRLLEVLEQNKERERW